MTRAELVTRLRPTPGLVAVRGPLWVRRVQEPFAFVLFISILSLGAGVVAGLDIVLLSGIVAIALIASLCFLGPKCRLIITAVGALLVFQSSFSVLKYAYLVLAVLCFVLSLSGIRESAGTIRREFRPLVLATLGLAAFLGFSFLVARTNGTSFDLWFRDALPYFLMTILPYVGISAGYQTSKRWNHIWIIVLGVTVSIGIAADWLERRGVSALPFGRFILSSATIVALCFSYTVTMAGLTRRTERISWTAVGAVILAAMILSGTRTNLVLLIAILGVIGLTRNSAVAPHRALALVVTIVTILVLVAPAVSRLVVADPKFFSSRAEAALAVLTADPNSDGSYGERKQSYEWTSEAFADHPFLGTGPGHLYPAPQNPTFNLDAPGIVPAKFGLIGIFFIIAFLWSIVTAVRRLRRAHGPFPTYSAARGWVLVLLALLPFGPWLEDKGFAVAIAILLACVVSESSRRVPSREDSPRGVGSEPSNELCVPTQAVEIRQASRIKKVART